MQSNYKQEKGNRAGDTKEHTRGKSTSLAMVLSNSRVMGTTQLIIPSSLEGLRAQNTGYRIIVPVFPFRSSIWCTEHVMT